MNQYFAARFALRILVAVFVISSLWPPLICNGAGENTKTVALVMKALSNPFFYKMEQGARGFAGDNDIPLEVFGIRKSTDVDRQISIVEDLISRNYGAIVIAPADSEKLIPVCKKAMEKGIVVINIDNPFNQDMLKAQNITIPFVGSDNREGGRLLGDYVSRRLKGRGNVLIVEGIRGVKNADLRKQGFTEAVTRDNNIRIIDSASAFWNTEKAFSLAVALFEKHPAVDAVFCANDAMALGVIKAMDLMNRDNILVAGYDNIDSVRTAIRNGKIHATMEQHPELMGEYGVMLAWRGLHGKPVQEMTDTPLDLITHDHFNKTIGLSVSSMENPFFATMVSGARQAAELFGMTLIVKDAADNQSRQLMDIVNFYEHPVDAVIINATNAETVIPALDIAGMNHIPVITVDRKVSGGNILTHIASDNVQGGRMAARMIAGYLSNKGKVVEIEGIPGTSAAHDRGSGFNRELNNYPDISVVAREAANFDREQAALFIRRIQRKGIVFDAVFAHNDAMILGALDELDKPDEPGKTGADKILVGYDAIKEAVSAVKEGKLTATIAQKPKEMGALSVKAAAQFFRGDPVDQFIPVDLSPVSLKKNDAGNTAP